MPTNVAPFLDTSTSGDRTEDLKCRLDHALRENDALRSRLESAAAPAPAEAFDQEAMEGLAEGFALFDADGRLRLFNSRYRDEILPRLADIIKPGVTFRTLVREAFERGLWSGIHENLDQF